MQQKVEKEKDIAEFLASRRALALDDIYTYN